MVGIGCPKTGKNHAGRNDRPSRFLRAVFGHCPAKNAGQQLLHGLPLLPGFFQASKAEGRKNLAIFHKTPYNFHMGTPTKPDPDIPHGADCGLCCPAPWNYGDTPGVVRIVFHAVEPCPGFPAFPNGITFPLYQDTYDHCYWWDIIDYGGETFRIQWEARYSFAQVRITTLGDILAFAGAAESCTGGPLSNNLSCAFHATHGGTANILDIPDPIITELAFTMNLQPDNRGLYDIKDGAEPGHKIVRLTGRDSQGSVLIDYEPP